MSSEVINMIIDSIADLKSDMKEEFRTINRKLDNTVTKEMCKNRRENCNQKEELSLKKISIYSTAVISIGGLLLGLAKLLGF